MKKNNYNKSFNRYEVKDKTSKFVKEKLPAYVLAIMMVFWTVASVLGIVAFFNRDKKESALNVINASAETIPQERFYEEFEIQLPSLQGVVYNGAMVMDSAFVYFNGKATYFVPNAYRQAFYNNEIDRNQFIITTYEGSVYTGDWLPIQIATTKLMGTADGAINFDISGIDDFPTTQNAFDFYSVNHYYLFVQKVDDSLRLYFEFNIFWYLDGVSVDNDRFDIALMLSSELVTSQVVKIPAYNFVSSSADLDTLVATDSTISNYERQALYFDYYTLYNDYNELVELNNSYVIALNELNTQLGVLENKIREYESLALDYPILENDLNNMIERYNALKRDYGTLERNYNSIRAEYELRLLERYEEGKRAGYVNGYDVGYAEGALNANEYTFDGLLSSVFDVPVRVFKSLFSFELLGVNLANFFLSLLTLAIIIFIVRWIL